MANKAPVAQPKFDRRISKLIYPMQGNRNPKHTLKRGFMIWEKPLVGYNALAAVHFLYNPSTVEATYPISDSTVGAILQFPNPHDKADLRVPLQQTVTWSLLFDRTYELWDSVTHNAGKSPGKHDNDPSVVGVLADVFQMQQFTGMLVNWSPGANPQVNTGSAQSSFAGHQGIIQIVPAYVYFGEKTALSFYGYVSEWDLQVTHWTQNMVPMRCVINISFTMLPPINNNKPGTNADSNWVANEIRFHNPGQPQNTITNASVSGVSGR